MTDLGRLAIRASVASHSGQAFEVTPEEFQAVEELFGNWKSADPAVKNMWKAVLKRHPVIDGVPSSFLGLQVVVTDDPPPRPNGLLHLSECLQVAHPQEARSDPERYPCTCDDWSPDQ